MFSFFKKKISEVFQGGQTTEQPAEQTGASAEIKAAEEASVPVETLAPVGDSQAVSAPMAVPVADSVGSAVVENMHRPNEVMPPKNEPQRADAQAAAPHTHVAEAVHNSSNPTPKEPAPAVLSAVAAAHTTAPLEVEKSRESWLNRLKTGLRKTGVGISAVFGGTQIDEGLYEDLEAVLLMADAGVPATTHLLAELRQRVKVNRATEPEQVKALLTDIVAELLQPLQKPLVIGEHTPTVIMVAGVNGAGKTTSIGKLTKHLSDAGQSVLLAAADTFRAAAREQLAVWADRNTVEIVSNAGGDPAALSFDAVTAGRARGKDVVLVDTAGRLPTQLHLMDELKKIRRTINKAYVTAPHEVLLVIDGNTGQNALAQVKAFDEALQLTGLVVTKLDGTAKGGVLCAIARERPVPVYFVGVGEQLEDLQTFNAREFAQALIG